jgi:hypothetical protein
VIAADLPGRTYRNGSMATEGHKHAERKSPKLMNTAEMDKELADIKREMEELELKMRQNKKTRCVYEWPMQKLKVKWPVRQLMVRRQQRLLRRWLRYAGDLKATEEEEMICYCWPETGRSLDDWDDEEDEMRSSEDLKSCHEDREEEIPDCQEGNELRSLRDLTYCQEDSEGISNFQQGNRRFPICQVGEEIEMRSAEDLMDCQEDSKETMHCQLGNERRSDEDLEDCQEGRESIEDCQEGSGSVLNCQVGRGEILGLSESLMDLEENQVQRWLLMQVGSMDLKICQGGSGSIPHCRNEQMSSELDCDQQVQLTAEEYHRSRMMIGGISIFLPFAQEEAENSVVHAATTGEQSQLRMTVKEGEELEQTLKAAQAGEENDCSKEQLNNLSRVAEQRSTVEMGLTAQAQAGAKEEDEHSEEWLSIFSNEAENNATEEVAEAEEEDTDNICLADLWDQMEALEERVKVQGEGTSNR